MKNDNVQASKASLELRKFGFSLGLGLNIVGSIMFYRHKDHFIWFTGLGSTVFMSAILYPVILEPIKKILDKIIFVIGWLTSAISLIIIFYLIITPVALLLKLFGKDLLGKKIDKKSTSYWIKRRQHIFSKESYERMG